MKALILAVLVLWLPLTGFALQNEQQQQRELSPYSYTVDDLPNGRP